MVESVKTDSRKLPGMGEPGSRELVATVFRGSVFLQMDDVLSTVCVCFSAAEL